MMSPLDWAFRPLERYADFSGRAPRAEYWWFYLFAVIAGIVAQIIDAVVGVGDLFLIGPVNLLVSLGLFIPWMAVTVRRLHDINKSGFYVLLGILPLLLIVPMIAVGALLYMVLGAFGILVAAILVFVPAIKLFIMTVTEGSRGSNMYGPNPYGLEYGQLQEVFR